jgi:hypothetical protein
LIIEPKLQDDFSLFRITLAALCGHNMLRVPVRACHVESISDALLEGSLQDGVHPVQDLVRVEILALLERELLRVAK